MRDVYGRLYRPPQSIDATRTRGIAAPDHDLPSRLRESMSGELAIVYTKRDYGCRESGPRSRAERDKSSRSVGEYAVNGECQCITIGWSFFSVKA